MRFFIFMRDPFWCLLHVSNSGKFCGTLSFFVCPISGLLKHVMKLVDRDSLDKLTCFLAESSKSVWAALEFLEPSFAGPESSTQKVPVNTAVLASRSPVFRKMFSSGMLESERDRPVIIKMSSQGKHTTSF